MMIISTNEPLGGENKRGTPTKKGLGRIVFHRTEMTVITIRVGRRGMAFVYLLLGLI